MTHFMAAFAVALTFALQSANAQDDVGRFYLGGNIGQVEADDFCVIAGTIDGITFTTTSCDDKDTGAKLYGGYNIHKNFAVEIGYIDFGESQITISNVDRVVRGRTTTKESTNSFFFAGIGKIHVHPKVSIFGKIGLHRWDAEYRWKSRHIADVTYGPRSFAFNGKSNDKDTDYFYGIGSEVAPFSNQKIKLRIEYEMFEFNGNRYLDFLSLGLTYTF